MAELLFELGCEELPASFVANTLEQLKEQIERRLTEALLPPASIKGMATPRRLIIGADGLADVQPDTVKESRGPALKAAFDSEGNPTKALEGFCRGQGITPGQVIQEGDYAWARVMVPGRPAREILAEILPASVRSLTFDKTMRWGSGRMRFARPIRWILATLDGAVVPFEIEGVPSGLSSRGHRFYAPAEFQATSFDQLIGTLRSQFVEPDASLRRQRIIEGAHAAASGTPDLSEALVDENVYLTEWPDAVEGSFPESCLVLPEPVLVTAMAKHERFFPVRDPSGQILPKFIAIRNAGEEATVRAGCEWVLNARFNDALFFYQEDARLTLDDFLAKTDRMMFQEKLGTVLQRSERLEKVAFSIAASTGADTAEASLAAKAGLYAKADLSSGLVGELASLQGLVGAEYARREGFDEGVCWAIGTQYDLSKNLPIVSRQSKTAVRLLLADQMDKLAGYLGIGIAPSGSSDPFGLRRSVTLLIEAAWAWPGEEPMKLDAFLKQAADGYSAQGFTLDFSGAQEKLADIFVGRYEAMLGSERFDVVQAALGDRSLATLANPRQIRAQLDSLKLLAGDPTFLQTASRPLNIDAAAAKKGEAADLEFTPENLKSPEGAALAAALAQLPSPESLDAAGVANSLKSIQDPIHAFFEGTMIMHDDPQVRAARLGLVRKVCSVLSWAGDLTKLVTEGR